MEEKRLGAFEAEEERTMNARNIVNSKNQKRGQKKQTEKKRKTNKIYIVRLGSWHICLIPIVAAAIAARPFLVYLEISVLILFAVEVLICMRKWMWYKCVNNSILPFIAWYVWSPRIFYSAAMYRNAWASLKIAYTWIAPEHERSDAADWHARGKTDKKCIDCAFQHQLT